METLTTLLQMNLNENTNENKTHSSRNETNPNSMIGICYVPMQVWETPYDDDTAYHVGTIFPCLNKPFLGGGR